MNLLDGIMRNPRLGELGYYVYFESPMAIEDYEALNTIKTIIRAKRTEFGELQFFWSMEQWKNLSVWYNLQQIKDDFNDN